MQLPLKEKNIHVTSWSLFSKTLQSEFQFKQPALKPSAVSLRCDSTNLRSDKVGRVARGHEQAVVGAQLLGEAKVADPDGLGVPRLVHVEDVAGLQVSVHHLEDKTQREEVKQAAKADVMCIYGADCGKDKYKRIRK